MSIKQWTFVHIKWMKNKIAKHQQSTVSHTNSSTEKFKNVHLKKHEKVICNEV